MSALATLEIVLEKLKLDFFLRCFDLTSRLLGSNYVFSFLYETGSISSYSFASCVVVTLSAKVMILIKIFGFT